MGYIRHNAIVVTGDYYNKQVETARQRAIDLGLPCSEIVASPTNGYLSFLIAPDGSKEGWEASNNGDKARAAWIEWVKSGSIYLDWALIVYGGDNYSRVSIENHNGKEAAEG